MVRHLGKRGVAVKGAGWVTPLGRDLERTWSELLLGRDAFTQMPSPYRLRNGLCAVVSDVPYALPPSERLFTMTVDAARAALSSAAIASDDERIVSVVGTSFGDSLDDPEAKAEPFAHLAERLALELRLRRPPVFISTACSSGSDALAVGFDLINSGEAEICLCGGTDVLTDIKRLAHSSLGTMSPTRLRAFDTRHDGTLLGEGAGFVVLQRSSVVDGRGVLGWLLGYGSANDAATMTAPDPNATGGRLAVERALASTGLEAADVAAFCAHGSGTVLSDDGEKELLNHTFRGDEMIVFATKGALGHSLGATGAIEAIALLLALRDGVVPPIVGLEQSDATLLHATAAAGQAMLLGGKIGLSLTLGFGGFDTCLALSMEGGR
jgi:3-oxoacyl-[acyl-carrier-protein] synthase II